MHPIAQSCRNVLIDDWNEKNAVKRNLNDPRMILQQFSSAWRDNMNNKCNLRIYIVFHFNSFDKKTICDVNILEAGWHPTVFSQHSSPNLYTIYNITFQIIYQTPRVATITWRQWKRSKCNWQSSFLYLLKNKMCQTVFFSKHVQDRKRRNPFVVGQQQTIGTVTWW